MTTDTTTVTLETNEENNSEHEVAELKRVIKQQKQRIEILEKSEKLYRSVVECARDFIFITDSKMHLTYLNPAALDYSISVFSDRLVDGTQASVSAILTKHFAAGDELNEQNLNYIRRAIESGNSYYVESQVPFPDHSRWFGTWLLPQKNTQGTVECLIGIARDITPRIQAQEDRTQSQERLRRVVTSAPITLWALDLNLNIIFTEGAALEELQLEPKKLIGRSLSEVDDKFSEQIKLLLPSLLEGETEVVLSGIKNVIFETRLSVLRNVDDVAYGVIGVSTTVTQRVKAEADLLAEKERLAVTLASIGDAVITTDNQGRVITWNRIAAQLTGWQESDALGKPIGMVFHIVEEKSRQFKGNPVSQLLGNPAAGPLRGDEKILIAKDGSETLISYTCASICKPDNEQIGIVLVFRDTSKQRVIEEEMHRVQKLESVGILAGGIAHDFNNILTTVMGNLSLVQRRLKDNEVAKTRLEDAEKAVLRARDLTNQLLTFSQGGVPIKTVASVQAIIEETAEFARTGSSAKCEIMLPENLWSVEVDEGQIAQVIQNLVINAHQAMPEGGTVTISARNLHVAVSDGLPLKPGRYVCISVRDTGIGIPSRFITRVFDPYFTTKKEGTGLGLATTYSIMRKHGGHITVESQENLGTTFHMFLPATDRRPSEMLKPVCIDCTGPGRILVMDDEKTIREIAGEILKDLGFIVEYASDGQEALRIYSKHLTDKKPFDAVLMDLTIPGGMGGKETIKHLLQLDPEAKAIVSSGYSNDPILSDFKKHGFAGMVTKPYGIDQLSKALSKILEPRN